MESNNVNKKLITFKKPFLKWNGEFNLGNLLTILVIIIATIGLYYQKRTVQTKVDDLQAVVAKLEEEKLNREIQGLQGEEKINNSFSYNLGYTIDQLRVTGQITDYEFMFMLTEFNELIDLSLKRKDLTSIEKQRLEILKQRNINKQLVFANGDMYTTKIIEFEKGYEPKEENFKTKEAYTAAQQIYVDTLNKKINSLLFLLDSLTREPIKNVRQLEMDYLSLQNKK
jgi:hypothetical protein